MSTSLTTNFPDGVTNADSTSAMGTLTQLDPSKLHTYLNDFNLYDSSDWIVTAIETTGSATQAIVDEEGGILSLTSTNAANDSIFLQLTNETFQFVSGKKLHFKARVKSSTAFNKELIIGLQIKDTTPLAVSDGVYFQQSANDTSITIHVIKDSVGSSAVLEGEFSNTGDTYYEVAFVYDGESEISYWLDDVKLGVLDTTNLPDDEVLTISFGIETLSTTSRTMSIDYIYVANER